MNLKPNIYYLTRDGRRAFVYGPMDQFSKRPKDKTMVGVIEGTHDCFSWHPNGRAYRDGPERDWDLIAEADVGA